MIGRKESSTYCTGQNPYLQEPECGDLEKVFALHANGLLDVLRRYNKTDRVVSTPSVLLFQLPMVSFCQTRYLICLARLLIQRCYSIALSDSTMLIFSSFGRMIRSTQNAKTNVSAKENR